MMSVNTKEIEAAIRHLLQAGLDRDINDPTIAETPARVARFWKEFIDYEPGNMKSFETLHSDQLVIIKNIPFYSLCEHHLLPIIGLASVGYLPNNGKVVGASKIPRLVQQMAHSLQMQERLTGQITDALVHLGIEHCATVTKAEHLCMKMRGIKSEGTMIVSDMRGEFLINQSLKIEFLALLGAE